MADTIAELVFTAAGGFACFAFGAWLWVLVWGCYGEARVEKQRAAQRGEW